MNEAAPELRSPAARRTRAVLSTLPVALLLAGIVVLGTGEALHARLLQWGEDLWPGYAGLRADPTPPDCDAEAGAAGAGEEAGDGFLDELLGEEETAGEAAAEAARQRCLEAQARYERRMARITPGLRAWRGVETAVASAVAFGLRYQRAVLVLLLLIGAVTATATRSHIAIRRPASRLDHRVSQAAQLVAAALLVASSYAKWRVDVTSGLEVQDGALPVLWTLGFAAMAATSVFWLWRPPAGLPASRGLGRALLTVPLFAGMAVVAGAWFLLVERHPAGLAIYLQKLTEHALLYVNVGLYVWAGMLLKRTRIAPLTFDALRPWGLPPEVLAFVVVAGAAIPTAYSGASGIFVIAAGAVIHHELVRAGARTSLAGAATAMSGSLGVVLAPCLLVVIVASLNREVTTDQLYGWGVVVFGLTAGLFGLAMVATRRGSLRPVPVPGAGAASLRALRTLAPYVLLGIAGALFYAWALGAPLDEHSAPVVLPVLLLGLLAWDRRGGGAARAAVDGPPPGVAPAPGWAAAVRSATRETTVHTGALLTLMALSVSLGGVIERSRVVESLPPDLGGPVAAMALLLVMLVGIGMVMDPYGAVILVSAALADVAYANGIDPVHFWMVVLVAFELGYLTPPVALNHLLARQVVGAEHEAAPAGAASVATGGFWRRHERLLLPLAVMATALLLVAFVPLLQ